MSTPLYVIENKKLVPMERDEYYLHVVPPYFSFQKNRNDLGNF